ncbi:PQQ-dependent sugar dehydrogenase [Nocardioides sp.]|uniref:PQQ-dependent sugar dehydrogenase n=1 Tax=Nocardioides sp. TaxID=35761 RepID=UPI002D7EEFFF|nr:PQQ-dependent sugar dehydrogenase [Nocardioides sp.]HET8959681.1 PQQ-dependent sugar dehydrogenase [Nocardioides sp.]
MSIRKPVPTALLSLVLLAAVLTAAPSTSTAAGPARPGAMAPTAPAARIVPPGFTQRAVMRRLPRATDMAFAPDGRLFVTLKSGVVRYRRTNGTVGTLLDFSRKINDDGERGLLGIAVAPRFATNRHLFLEYTHRATPTQPLHNRLVRVTVRNGRLAPGSERTLFRFNALRAGNHNGGTVQVGPDGKLYVSHGENARQQQAQSLRTLLGKIVRLNRNGTIPADNPFFNRTTGRNRAIWARGLRNPFKFAFDPRTGRGFVNDVGAQTWEEINRLTRGGNYGWPAEEGPENSPRFIPPLFAYRHGTTGSTGCSITGGEFYRSARRNFPARFVGDYFFADFCNGWVRRYDPRSDRVARFATGLGSPVDLEVGSAGALYVLVHGRPGRVVRIRFNG